MNADNKLLEIVVTMKFPDILTKILQIAVCKKLKENEASKQSIIQVGLI